MQRLTRTTTALALLCLLFVSPAGAQSAWSEQLTLGYGQRVAGDFRESGSMGVSQGSQSGTAPAPGDRVRVTAIAVEENRRYVDRTQRYVGTLVALAGDSLVLATDGTTTTWRMPSVTRLDVYRGRKSAWLKGMIIGAGVAGAASFAFWAWFLEGLSETDGTGDNGETWAIVGGLSLAWAAGGALLGAGIGAQIRSDRWEEVPPERLRLSIGSHRATPLAIAASVRF